MKSFLILRNLKVENANAISGLTYGFPSITQFLGYVHALSRKLNDKFGLKLGGCGVVCHSFQMHMHKSQKYADNFFILSKHPLTKEGKNSSINEEGKMHMEVSLIIECLFSSDNLEFGKEDDNQELEKWISNSSFQQPLAGGAITSPPKVEFYSLRREGDFIRSIGEGKDAKFSFVGLLPGFALIDRSKIFQKYLSENNCVNALEGLLDFCAIKSKWVTEKKGEEGKENGKWAITPKPFKGWLVPIQIGYHAISPLYEKGKVKKTRDFVTPVRFVEPLYSLGEWIGVHKIKSTHVDKLIWNYHFENQYYICKNKGV